MKRIFTLLSCAATLFMVGCMNDIDDGLKAPSEDSLLVELLGSINQTTSRVSDEGFCDGDGVGIYVVNYKGESAGTMLDKGNQADNVRYVYSESENKWTPDYPVYYYDKVTPVDIIGYYPYVPNVNKVNSLSFEVAKDQAVESGNGLMGGYESSDFLWGKAIKVTPTASRVNVTFHHKMAGVKVELIEGEGFAEGEWDGLNKQVLVANTVRKAIINLTSGEVEPVGEAPNTSIVSFEKDGVWRAVVVPQQMEASVALFNITVDGTSYIYRNKVEGTPTTFEYISGKQHTFTIEVSKKEQSGLTFELVGEAITPWESEAFREGSAMEYVIINVPKASTEKNVSALQVAIEESGKDYTKIKNMKITGEVNVNDFYFMRDKMTALQRLNMKECTVAEGKNNGISYKAHEIPYYAMRNKSSLVRIILPDDVVDIGSNAFSGTNLLGVLTLPESLEKMSGSQMFMDLSGLTSVEFNSKLKEIGVYAFKGCSGLVGELDIPESVVSIGSNAFFNCNGITSLKLPSNLETIGPSAFASCTALSGSLVIPNKVRNIANSAFFNCGFDGSLTLPDGLLTIENDAFYGCKFKGELHLPKSLLSIGAQVFLRGNFSGKLILPNNLMAIGASAFEDCKRLSGVVEIPEGVVSISASAFSGCNSLEGVVFPCAVETISSKAFNNCYQIGSVVCKAELPPILAADAFNGVAKDNFTVEVPEQSVSDYTLASNWKEFKRIAAHRNFSISRNLFRTLNAEDSKVLVLRADEGASWSVESAPEWVTVTPMEGSGKKEVTITISTLDRGAANRTGEVVFALNGTDSRVRTKVEQYNYTYGDGDVIKNQSASVGNGVNIVFMGDCFDAQDIATGKYLDGVNEAIEYFFSVEPYATYKPYFNIYTVFGLSPDSGVGSVNTIREARFGSQYGLQAAGSVGVDENICFEYACKAPTVTKENIHQTPIVLVENTFEYDGITYMWGDGSAIALCPMSQDAYPYDYRGIVQHEAGGHAFGKLGDEYIYHNAFIQTCTCTCCNHISEFNTMKSYGFYENLSLTANMYEVPWSHLIFDEKYQNTVDVYEGGFFHTRGVFRSEQNSCMNNNIPYFSAISRQAIVERIMDYAGEKFSYNEWKANDKGMNGSNNVATRAYVAPYGTVPYKAAEQSAPQFMGEKPELNF